MDECKLKQKNLNKINEENFAKKKIVRKLKQKNKRLKQDKSFK